MDAHRMLIFVIILNSLFSVSRADYRTSLCFPGSNYTSNSTYAKNLKNLLVSLNSFSSSTGFVNTSDGQGPDTAYGLIQCQGDVSSDVCKACATDATARILQACPNCKSAVIWYNECLLRYSDANFFGNVDDSDTRELWNIYNVTNPTAFNQLMGSLMRNLTNLATTESYRQLFAMGKVAAINDFQSIYALVQCTRDLSMTDCNTCLTTLIARIPVCCNGSQGVLILSPSCKIRYETYLFYNETYTSGSNNSITNSSMPSPSPSPPSKGHGTIIVAVVVAVAVCVVAVILVFLFCWRRNRKASAMKENEGSEIPIEGLAFKLRSIRAATNNFSEEFVLGKGGFGPVYKGVLGNGQEIAVKKLSSVSAQGAKEFKNEINLIVKLQHRNLVRLLGYCFDSAEMLLIYEYMPNSSLDKYIFDPNKKHELDWITRHKIIIGIARGILYLHEDSRLKVIHRDLKASNILLDNDMNPKISDFGLAKLVLLDQTEVNTKTIVGTYGYMSPEYANYGFFSEKSDVYSFGVLVLEIITGKRNNLSFYESQGQDLIMHAWMLWKCGKPLDVVDDVYMKSIPAREVERCIHIALLCVQNDAAMRPTMSSVVLMFSTSSMSLGIPLAPESSILGPESSSTGKSSSDQEKSTMSTLRGAYLLEDSPETRN